MKTSSLSGRIIALLGLIGAIVVVYLLLTGGDGDRYELTAEFENASQLVTGNEVILGGTAVGLIDEIELGPNGSALVNFHLNEGFGPLHRGTEATIRSYSLSGVANRQIQLTLPPDETIGDEIPSGGTLTQSETVSEVDLDQIFNALDAETAADLKKVIRGFELSYEGVGEEANEGTRFLNPFLSTSRQLFEELTRDAGALENLVVDGAQLSGALAARRDDVSSLVSNLNQMMGALGRQKTSLASAVNQLPSFMRDFNTTGANLRATLDDVDPLVDASKPVAVKLQPFFAEFRAAARDLVPTIADLDTVIKRPGSNNDLIELTRLQSPLTEIAAGPVDRNGSERAGAFPEASRSLRDSLQQLAFFRAYTPELVGWFDDFGHSGITDANGGIGRIGTTFNTFPVSPNGLPGIDPSDPLFGAQGALDQLSGMTLGNNTRCPGSNERSAPDEANPYTEGGTLDCDPTQVLPGP